MTEVFGVPANVRHSYDCSSIEKIAKRKSKGKARLENALKVIAAVVKRANTKFTPEELARFNAGVSNILDFQEAA